MNEEPLGVLPTDLIIEICKFIDLTQLILSISQVCKMWQEDVCTIIMRNYLPKHQTIASFNDMFRTRHGKCLLKQCLRREVMSLAREFYKNQQVVVDSNSVHSKPHCMESELERLKRWFGQFSDIRHGVKPPIRTTSTLDEMKKDRAPKGFFQKVLGFVEFLGEEKKAVEINNYTIVGVGTHFFSTHPNPFYDVMYKAVLEGTWGVGKTSFLHCLRNRKTIDSKSSVEMMGLEFNMTNWCIENEFKIRSQVWDSYGTEQFGKAYKGASFILLMFDMTHRGSFEELQSKFIHRIKPTVEEFGLDVEFIVIATHLDEANKRQVSSEEGEKFALHVVSGAPYVEISNKDWSNSHILTWYCSLFKYLIVVDKSKEDFSE